MAIYLDAGVLYDLTPQSLAWSSLRVIAREQSLDVAIPEVALNEATSKRREQITSKGAAIRAAIDKAEGFFPLPTFQTPDAKRIADRWRTEMLRGLRVIPTTQQHALEALDRELHRIAPAREGKGTRDAAIWLAIRDDHAARNEPGYFVSRNHQDFGEPPNGDLHSDLRAEIVGHQPFTNVREISALLPLLTDIGGMEFTVSELESSVYLKPMMKRRLEDESGAFGNLDQLIETAFKAPLHWSAVAVNVREPKLTNIARQTVYRLSKGQEVAVVRTS